MKDQRIACSQGQRYETNCLCEQRKNLSHKESLLVLLGHPLGIALTKSSLLSPQVSNPKLNPGVTL